MVSMEELARKLSLWDTRTFRPIMTHDDLEPILAAAGFVPLQAPETQAVGGVAWREYAFCGIGPAERIPGRRRVAPPAPGKEGLAPRPRLPFPRVDGLHLLAYKAFLDAFGFYVGADRVSDHFHVRAMSLSRTSDRVFDKAYRAMKDCEMEDEGIFVYREGTLDQVTKLICSYNINNESDVEDKDDSKDGTPAPNTKIAASNPIHLVPLKDLFPPPDV